MVGYILALVSLTGPLGATVTFKSLIFSAMLAVSSGLTAEKQLPARAKYKL